MIPLWMKRRKAIKRTSRPRFSRATRTAAEKREADRLARLICFKRYDATCQNCGTKDSPQWAHGFSRRFHQTRWAEKNAWVLCRGCHFKFTLDDGLWKQWMRNKLGDAMFDAMHALAYQPGFKWDGSILFALQHRAKELGIDIVTSKRRSRKVS